MPIWKSSGGAASAYDIAVANGFVGDEATWLLSLEGTDGADGAGGGSSGFLLVNAVRAFCYTDNRWVTESDDLRGFGAQDASESAGTGTTNPTVDYDHIGMYVPSGHTVKGLTITGRANHSSLTDVEIFAYVRKPNPITGWESGIDANGEMTNTKIHGDLFMNPTGGATAFTGACNDMHRRNIPLDVDITEDSFLSIYLRPTGTITSTRYFYVTYTWELEKT